MMTPATDSLPSSNASALGSMVTLAKPFVFVFVVDTSDDDRSTIVCMCDHPVTKAEWDDHFDAYDEQRQERKNQYVRSEISFQAYLEWREANKPELSFQKLHDMQVLQTTEFWRT